MPDFEVTDPSGKKFIVTAPDGATQEQVLSFAQSRFAPSPPTMGEVAANAAAKAVASTIDLPIGIENIVRFGLSKIPGMPESYSKPKMGPAESAARSLGAIDPSREPQTAEQRYVDTAVQTGIATAMSPAKGALGIAKNVATGIVSGTVAQAVKESTGSDLLKIVAGIISPIVIGGFRAKQATNLTPTGKVTLKDAREAGYVVQPSTVSPSMITNKLESVAGKAAVAQDAALRNQAVTNKLAARAIGLADDAPITPAALESVRDQAGKVYEQVDQLRAKATNLPWFQRYHSTSLSEDLKQARADARQWYKAYDRSADPAMLAKAESSSSLAQSIERDMEMIAKASGQPDLMEQLRAARNLYARTFVVERALNVGDGNVSAAVIGRLLDQGQPLTGELKVIGKFAQAFPRVARDAAAVPPAGVAGTDAFSAAMLGTIGYGAAGGPAGLAAAGLPLLRSPARRFVLSEGYQTGLTAPPDVGPAVRAGLVGKTLLDYKEQTQ